MDAIRFGNDVRLLRRRRGWTQGRLASEAKVSRWAVGEVEVGRAGKLALEQLIAIAAAVGGYLSVRILFQGEGLDRLRDRRHAALVEEMVRRLRADGWEVAIEVSFNLFGERGSIDILAFHPAAGTLLIIEVKTVVPDVGSLLATIDRKVRLAPNIARSRGWNVRSVSRLLVLPEASTARRRVVDHDATFANAFPARNVEVNRWLPMPTGRLSGLIFLSPARVSSTRRGRSRPIAPQDTRPRTTRT